MEKERLTWRQIKERYPHRYVGLVDIEEDGNPISVKNAVVKFTDEDTSYDELVRMAACGKIMLRYTTADEDEMMGFTV